MSDPAKLAFLPWVRQGAAAGLSTTDSLAPSQPAVGSLDLTLHLNGEPDLPTTLAVRGPADVVGLDPNQVIRLEPRAGTTDFEPNFFAAIEFDRVDLPWLFTPLKPGDQSRLRPWLCLAVVAKGEGVELRPAGAGPLAQLSVQAPAQPIEELPDPSEAWAWTHAQAASGDKSQASVGAALNGGSELSLARLVSSRRLKPNTEYIACVVPAFELGRKAGLGLQIDPDELTSGAPLAPAWSFTSTAPTAVLLPVYYSWSFRTGNAGDFEALAKRLTPRAAPERLGLRAADFGAPGFPLPGVTPPVAIDVGGALQPVDAPEASPPWPTSVQTPFQAGLADIVNTAGEVQAADPNADPILAPPLYGRWTAARTKANPGAAPWFDELNLDPRWRSIAAYGVQVVQTHQEALMASAWAQAGDMRAANQKLRHLQLSLAAGARLHARHFQALDPDTAVRITAPAFGRLRSAPASGGAAAPTLYAQLAVSPVPVAATSAAMRRLGRARGPVSRRAAVVPVNAANNLTTARRIVRVADTSWISVLNGDLSSIPATPVTGSPLPALATVGAIRAQAGVTSTVQAYSQVTADEVNATGPHPLFHVLPEGQAVHPMPPPPGRPGTINDTAGASAFRKAAAAHLGGLNPGRPMIIIDPVHPLSLSDLRATVMQALDPHLTLTLLATAVINVGPGVSPPVNSTPDRPPLDQLQMVPHFPQPMYGPLRDLSQDLMLPGLDAILPDTVLGLKTNRRFIEAYMIGLNGEMGGELLWRGFPTDQRGTYFDQFWDVGGSSNPEPDIDQLTSWADHPLGKSPTPGEAAGPERFVMLVRSALLQRYPNAVIYAVKALRTPAGRVMSEVVADEIFPVFTGALPPDVAFFGFALSGDAVTGADGGEGYYLVIQEHPTEPRFGLSQTTPSSEHDRVSALSAPPAGTSLAGLSWGGNGAQMAGILRHRPVRVAIHGSRLRTPSPEPTS